jgi:proteasome accessory factor C
VKPAIHERLRRLLFLVPYVAKRPGIGVDELAGELGLGREALLEELDLLTLVGRPPFQPDDYIDVHVENDRVYVHLDQRLSAPPRLTAAEAAALAAAAELFRPAASEALHAALVKLEQVIPPGTLQRYREMHSKIDAGQGAAADLSPLMRALVDRRELEFDYFSQSRGATERRTVRPLELFNHRGQWYLSAHCCARGEQRLFRVDRMQGLLVTERGFAADGAKPQGMPDPTAAARVRVRVSPLAAPYVRERFGEDARLLPDGSAEVYVSGESERWLTHWILSFGGEAEVVEPPWARDAVARAAALSLSC